MSHEEDLDSILKFIKNNNNRIKGATLRAEFIDKDFDLLIHELKDRKFINDLVVYNVGREFVLLKSGEMFIDDGGFVEKKKRDKRIFYLSEQTYFWAKIAGWAAVIGAIAAIIALFR